MARIHNQSVRNIILADKIEVRTPSEFPTMFYIATLHGDKASCVADTDLLVKFFPNEALAWKFVKKYRDLDQPRLVD